MKKLIGAILFTTVIFAPLAAQAGPLNNRLERQEHRIDRGVKNGSLSPREYNRLEKRTEKIEADRLRAIRSGGKLTNAEKYRLNHRLNRNSRSIYREKHD
jgi:Ni/Co efflux regulator RcnB